MKVLLSVGHSILKSGACTSADGRPYGGVLEYSYNKGIVNRTADYLRKAGHRVDVLLCPELQFSRSTEESAYKLQRVNKGGYDLVVELHLNASNYHNAGGCEVLYICEKGKQIAQQIQGRLSAVFSGRPIQRRTDLYMLTKTVPVSLIVESFFCDNAADCAAAKKADVARLIAEGIHGGDIPGDRLESEETDKEEAAEGTLYRVQVGAYSVRANAEAMKKKLKAAGFEAILVAA